MYVYKTRSLTLFESFQIISNFKSPVSLVQYMKILKEAADEMPGFVASFSFIEEKKARLDDQLQKGLVIAKRLNATDADIEKRQRYENVFVTFLTESALKWNSNFNVKSPILFWQFNNFNFLISLQKLFWLEPYAEWLTGTFGPNNKFFANDDALQEYFFKKSEESILKKEYNKLVKQRGRTSREKTNAGKN